MSVRFLVPACLLFLLACSSDSVPLPDPEPPAPDFRLRLRWVPDDFGLDWSGARTGLAWTLSNLGAGLPAGSLDLSITALNETDFELDLSLVGFSDEALDALLILLEEFRASEAYGAQGGIDLGRFVMLTLGSSWHYYAITGAAPDIETYQQEHPFETPLSFSVLESCISLGQRGVAFNPAQTIDEIVFICREGEGNLLDGSFVADDYEVIDVMANGQTRYALYDLGGNLKPAGDASRTDAGKPAKCMWCHETVLQPAFCARTSAPNSLTPEQFNEVVLAQTTLMNVYRQELEDEIDFEDSNAHTQGELIYVHFMEPSLARIAREWKLTEEEALGRLDGLETHTNGEYPEFGGGLYHRAEVDQRTPYGVIQVPDSAREPSFYEPKIIWVE